MEKQHRVKVIGSPFAPPGSKVVVLEGEHKGREGVIESVGLDRSYKISFDGSFLLTPVGRIRVRIIND